MQLVGELWNFRPGRARVYFELRDSYGALPCSMWASDFEMLGIRLTDGMRVVVGGGCDYYPGSGSASPSFGFDVTELRIEGEGDLLDPARAAAPQARRRRPVRAPEAAAPAGRCRRSSASSRARAARPAHDVLAGLRRRGWAGRLVWAFAPVQDRHAAPAISAALRELAACPEVEVVIVARGGGSLADLFAFCDEALCRTVALLRVPVIASVGHHTDRTLIDDVAAVACSTPTHAAQEAVPVDLNQARAATALAARRLHAHARRAVLHRARELAQLSRAPTEHVARHRRRLHQLLRELRAGARRAHAAAGDRTRTHHLVLTRSAGRAAGPDTARRRSDLERLTLALAAHDPQRTLERGYALVEDRAGQPVTSAGAAHDARELQIRFHDARVDARVP